jgi:hypothetical protein
MSLNMIVTVPSGAACLEVRLLGRRAPWCQSSAVARFTGVRALSFRQTDVHNGSGCAVPIAFAQSSAFAGRPERPEDLGIALRPEMFARLRLTFISSALRIHALRRPSAHRRRGCCIPPSASS